MSIEKTVSRDEIDINVCFNDGYPQKIEITIKNKSIFIPLDMENDMLLNQMRDTIANYIIRILNKNLIQKRDVKETILKDKKCPNCDNPLGFKKPCCAEAKKLAEKGIMGILKCSKCGYRGWVKESELKEMENGN